ncbi:MAG: VanW family protein [Patescibacteria group bacterium]
MDTLRKLIMAVLIAVAVIGGAFGAYSLAYAGKIFPRVSIGIVPVGSLNRADAVRAVESHLQSFREQGVILQVGEKSESIPLDEINADMGAERFVARAFTVGREGDWRTQLWARLRAPFLNTFAETELVIDAEALQEQINAIAEIFDNPGKDIRFKIEGTQVAVLTDTKVGQIINRDQAVAATKASMAQLNLMPIVLTLQDDIPVRNSASITEAQRQAKRILAAPLQLQAETESFTISQSQLGQWIKSGSDENNLVPAADRERIAQYVTTLASQLNIVAQQPVIRIEDGKVSEFRPPRSGQALEEDRTIDLIIAEIELRRTKPASKTAIVMPIKTTKPVSNVINGPQGIVELLGKATTTFAGSPANRRSNIQNGVRFLSGILVPPGEEFSTIKTLGTVDNTTGYLPELVIKENRTIPEFGGGLCQVSTTLFRAILNAGLPITARQNHSYRVSYYEKDGAGRYIGPGLDATIYQPNPDLKFKNDTSATILIYAYVLRDTLTFELYGTHDGRKASIKGPTLLSTIPAGDPIYAETDTLPAGVTKQIETAHAGGSAVAIYSVTYPDGKVKTQEFRSYYRRWPARYLVGTGGVMPSSSPAPPITPTPAF